MRLLRGPMTAAPPFCPPRASVKPRYSLLLAFISVRRQIPGIAATVDPALTGTLTEKEPVLKNPVAPLLAVLALLASVTARAQEPLPRILAKVAAAYGAIPPAAIRETGRTVSRMRGEGSLLRIFQSPDKFRIEIDYPSGTESRTMVGTQAWTQNVPANSMQRGAIALQAGRIALPWNILARPEVAVDRGTAAATEGKSVRVIEFPLEDQLKLVVDIDPDSGYILRSRGIQVVGDKTLEFAAVYSGFRKENSRVHAAHEEQFAMGMQMGYSVIEKVDYPESLPESTFVPDQPRRRSSPQTEGLSL